MKLLRYNNNPPTTFLIDLDGVLTDGVFVYSSEGKQFKNFSVDDHDGIRLIQRFVTVHVITADLVGFPISRKRVVDDMELPLTHVGAQNRLDWITEHFDISRTIYMGDGIFDYEVFQRMFYSIAPANALPHTKKSANFVTNARGGDRAVAEACLHIARKFFNLDH